MESIFPLPDKRLTCHAQLFGTQAHSFKYSWSVRFSKCNRHIFSGIKIMLAWSCTAWWYLHDVTTAVSAHDWVLFIIDYIKGFWKFYVLKNMHILWHFSDVQERCRNIQGFAFFKNWYFELWKTINFYSKNAPFGLACSWLSRSV